MQTIPSKEFLPSAWIPLAAGASFPFAPFSSDLSLGYKTTRKVQCHYYSSKDDRFPFPMYLKKARWYLQNCCQHIWFLRAWLCIEEDPEKSPKLDPKPSADTLDVEVLSVQSPDQPGGSTDVTIAHIRMNKLQSIFPGPFTWHPLPEPAGD